MRTLFTFLLLLTTSSIIHVHATILVTSSNMTYVDHPAAFGPRLSENGKIGFLVEPKQDPTGCSIVEPPCEDWIALVQRGGCSFITKVRNMQESGASAVAVGDPEHPGRWITMYAPGDTSDILIPSVFLAQREYLALLSLANLANAPLQIHMQVDDFISWPLIDVLIIVIVSPTIMLFFIYISWQIRQRQRRQQELAPYDMVSRLQLKKFSHEKVKENEREECVICLEDYQEGEDLRVLPCQHDFHAACVDAWLTTQKKFCPICKRDISSNTVYRSNSEITPLLDA
ncbi:hypothetical protein LRAMOSA06492 [Lichtheimia ramosa]|uniref:RING-type E3 ubiquitin transferase n=1 Tax=Lichtheimia ramosa TaxID=688394 RepID=A0A077X537_9FUNG|nr:hypothetical protein LRAMOSA06492 [Lichtheimia ramosa]